MTNDEMIKLAKELAAKAINDVNKKSISYSDRDLSEMPKHLCEDDMFIVWFSKTLQNWKALVSTSCIPAGEYPGNYVEVTYNGDKKEAYVDVYCKNANIAYAIIPLDSKPISESTNSRIVLRLKRQLNIPNQPTNHTYRDGWNSALVMAIRHLEEDIPKAYEGFPIVHDLITFCMNSQIRK